MTIRPATQSDAVAVAAIWNPVIQETMITFNSVAKTPEDVLRLIRERDAAGFAFLVAEMEGEVQGFATYGPFRAGVGYAHTAEHTIILAPQARGQGTGRALMCAIEDHARARDIRSMIAGTSAASPDSIGFHKAMGYTNQARLPQVGQKNGQWLDLVLMQKFL